MTRAEALRATEQYDRVGVEKLFQRSAYNRLWAHVERDRAYPINDKGVGDEHHLCAGWNA